MHHPRTVLVFTRHTPFPWEDGSGAYLFDILRYLHAHGYAVHVAWLNPPAPLQRHAIFALPGSYARIVHLHLPGAVRIGRHLLIPGTWLRRAMRWVRNPHTGHGPTRQSCALEPEETVPLTPALRAYASRLCTELRPTAVIANFAWLAPLFTAAPPEFSFRRICLHPEVAWKRAAARSARTGSPATITAGTEIALLGSADAIVCPSSSVIGAFRQLLPDGDYILTPPAQRPQPLPPARNQRLLFVGSRTAANAEGLAWFLSEVWPLVRTANPAAELDICGSVAEHLHIRPPGTVFHGNVPDLVPYYRNASLVVVPLRRGDGFCLKLLEAAANGRAVVTARAPLEGAPFLAGTVAVADTAADFAMHTASLLATPTARLELAERALAAVRGRLDPDSCYSTLLASLGP